MTTNERVGIIDEGISRLVADNADIKSVLSIGSFSQGTMDAFSDIDLYIFTNDVKKYISFTNAGWIAPLGNAISRRIFKDIREGVDKNKIILDNGLMYDLTIVNTRRFNIIKYYFALKGISFHKLLPKFLRLGIEANIAKFYQTVRRGYKIHKDEMRLEAVLQKAVKHAAGKQSGKIPEPVFINRYNNFWQSCYTASVKLLRGDFYFAILVYDQHLKRELIVMLEWYARCNDESVDVFYDSLKIRQWGGEQVYQELFGTLLHGNILEMQQTLVRSAKLYRKFSAIVAAKYNFPLNARFEDFVLKFIENVAMKQPVV